MRGWESENGSRTVFDEVRQTSRKAPGSGPRVIILTAFFWVLVFGITFLGTLIYDRARIGETAALRLCLSIAGSMFCYGLHIALRGTERKPLPVRALIAALMLVPTIAFYTCVSNVLAYLIEPKLANQTLEEVVFSLVSRTWLFVAWTAVYFTVQYSFAALAEEQRAQVFRESAQTAKLLSLHHQINPHFLFNTLNSVSALVLEKRLDDAEMMLANLSGFLRSSFALDLHTDIPLSQEIALQRLYLEIEQVRFPDLSFETDIGPDCDDALVPPLILQPVFENAIKHAVSKSRRPTALRLTAKVLGKRLNIVVDDDGPGGKGSEGTGTGLRNIEERLKTRFDDGYDFKAVSLGSRGFCVSIILPVSYQ